MAVNIGTAVAYLQLDAQSFNSGLATAQSSLSQYQTSFSSAMTGIGSTLTTTGTALTTGVTVPLANAAKEIITFGADFDKQMSAVRAVMGDITDEQFEALRNAAIGWGEKTVYTATEAGEALYYMGLAGWNAEQAINGLGSVLNLAAAGQMDLGRASDVVTDSMTAMNLVAGKYTNNVENTSYYTSVLAAVMANSNTDVNMLGESFKYVAPIAGQLGFTIEDLGLALGLAANAGIKSSQAGTSLRQAFKQLISPTDKTAAAMEKYGISLFDAQGKALPLRQIMLQLQQTFGDLGVEVIDTNGELKDGEAVMEEYGNSLPISQQEKLKAVVDLFGTRAMPTMLAIIQQAGGEFDKLATAIDNAAGTGTYASEMAETQLDNLAGDWTKFTSALGTTKIMLQDLLNSGLRELVQQLTELVRKFNELDDAHKKNILKWGAIVAAIGPVMTIFGRLMLTIGQLAPVFTLIGEKVSTFTATLTRMRWGWFYSVEESGSFMAKLAQLGGKMNWIVAIIMLVITAIIDLWKNSEQFRNWIKDAFQSLLKILKRVWEHVSKVLSIFNEVWTALARSIEPIIEILAAELSPALDAVFRVLSAIFGILEPILEIIGAIIIALTPIVEFIAGIVASILGIISEIVTWIVDKIGWLLEWIVKGIEWLKYVLIGDPIIVDLIEGIKSILAIGFEFIKTITETLVNAIRDLFDWLREEAIKIIDLLVTGVQELFQNLYDWFVEGWEKFTKWLSDSWQKLKTKISESLEAFITMLRNLLQRIHDTARQILNAIFEAAQAVWNQIVQAFETAKQHILDGIRMLKEKFDELKEAIIQKFNEIRENIEHKFEEIKEALGKLVEMIKEKFNNLLQHIKEHFQQLFAKIKEFGTNFVNAWKNAFQNVQRGIASVFNNIRNGFVDFGKSVFNVARQVGQKFIEGLLGTGRSIKEFFSNFIQSAVRGLLSALKAFKETGRLLMENLWKGIKEKWNDIVKLLQELWNAFLQGDLFGTIFDKLKNAISGSNVKNKAVNGSHADGLAYVPFNGYIAELHKGERVLTAEENQRYSSGGEGTTINFYSNERIDEYTAAKELRRTIKDMELGLV